MSQTPKKDVKALSTQGYRQAAALLPPRLRQAALGAGGAVMERAEELRLRAGRPMSAVAAGEEVPLPDRRPVEPGELEQVVEIATQASPHAALERLRSGFFTVRGGHRIGICGAAVVREGTVYNLRSLSSLAIRIARQVPGAAAPVADRLWEGDEFQSTLILSPPGGGKTTLLRDLIRRLSDGVGHRPLRVGVADERGEVAGLWDGVPQLDVGGRTDVMDGCPKGTALLMLLRGMNPQVLAADEITDPQDCAALLTAANCGVGLLCTAHAAGLEDLRTRPMYRPLLEERCFRRLVVLASAPSGRRYQVSGL